MRIDFITLFPDSLLAGLRHGVIERAEKERLVEFRGVNPRDFATDKYRSVDDEPYGGGPGMVLKADVLAAALKSVLQQVSYVIVTDPNGTLFQHSYAESLSRKEHLIFVCGHYEGIDERFVEKYANARFSIGDFVVTGGELPAALMANAIVRLIPGVLGSPESLCEDAFYDGLLTYHQYTRPEDWEGLKVPDILLSGDHQAIARWRRRQRLLLTRKHRPDLFARAPLSKNDLELLK